MSTSNTLKRNFTPTVNTTFNPTKKFKPSFQTHSDSLSSSFNTASSVPSANFNPTVPQPFNLLTGRRSRKTSTAPTEDLQMEIVQFRPKFKARPMPKYPAKKEIERSLFSRSLSQTQQRNNSQFRENYLKDDQINSSFKSNLNSHPVLETAFRTHSCSFFPKKSEVNPPFSPRSYQEEKPEFKFVAKPMPSFSNVFVPVTTFIPTQPVNFELNTGKRAVEREKFSLIIKDKENLMNEMKEEEARLEAEYIRSYRKTLNFKAKPLQILQPFLVKRSEEPLTKPQSPILQTKIRSFQKENNEDFMDID